MKAIILITLVSILTAQTATADMLDYQNKYREALGLQPLQVIEASGIGIEERAKFIYENKSKKDWHENWTGFVRMGYLQAGENICDKGYWEVKRFNIRSDYHCVDAFKVSPSHKDNLLGKYKRVATAKYKDIIVIWYFN